MAAATKKQDAQEEIKTLIISRKANRKAHSNQDTGIKGIYFEN